MNEKCPLESGTSTRVSELPEMCQRICGNLMYEGEVFTEVGKVALSDDQSECLHSNHWPNDIEPAVMVGRSFLSGHVFGAAGNRTLMAEHDCDDCGVTLDVDNLFICPNTPAK